MPEPQKQKELRSETCPKHGAFKSEHVVMGSMGHHLFVDFWTKCPECKKEEQLKQKKEEEERMWREYCESLVNRAQIPNRFREKTLDAYLPTADGQRGALLVARDYAEYFKGHRAAGRCLLFVGRPGTGKTHLACAIGTAVARKGNSVLYITVAELIRRIRSTWNHESRESTSCLLERLGKLDLLILDEVGVQYGSESELSILTEILGVRYDNVRPTLLISNCKVSELPQYLSDRGVDRLRENGGKVVCFDWPSHRQ